MEKKFKKPVVEVDGTINFDRLREIRDNEPTHEEKAEILKRKEEEFRKKIDGAISDLGNGKENHN